jgi:hypothetical protein
MDYNSTDVRLAISSNCESFTDAGRATDGQTPFVWPPSFTIDGKFILQSTPSRFNSTFFSEVLSISALQQVAASAWAQHQIIAQAQRSSTSVDRATLTIWTQMAPGFPSNPSHGGGAVSTGSHGGGVQIGQGQVLPPPPPPCPSFIISNGLVDERDKNVKQTQLLFWSRINFVYKSCFEFSNLPQLTGASSQQPFAGASSQQPFAGASSQQTVGAASQQTVDASSQQRGCNHRYCMSHEAMQRLASLVHRPSKKKTKLNHSILNLLLQTSQRHGGSHSQIAPITFTSTCNMYIYHISFHAITFVTSFKSYHIIFHIMS